ncbi:TolC family protein [Roseimaritima ulvae]|uniref:Cobalt-zinc-cadmium resistance protein CzcC n=1 Tax=Roseimaritima ulvae TaxID=980254 RepID=A0A5B9QUB5_9BACT|nr:TolC family protein [Roseimaritima ulvae]QEG41532.1 Cobalt-zinc-cadmium resistance protein CzcC precursor [Roseimaritima ulvae]
MSKRRRNLVRLLLLTTTSGMIGCSTLPAVPSAPPPVADEADNHVAESLLAAPPVAESPNTGPAPGPENAAADNSAAETRQVAFDEPLLGSAGGTPPVDQFAVHAAVPFMDVAGVTRENAAQVSAAMTLADFEALALGNNPTLAELAATTRKAAGFRTQVGLYANPSVGYQANQLADEGTDQHTVYISQTIVTGDKLERNRRVQNEALRAQLLLLEAQKYRVKTDVHVKFYDALAAQQRVQLIQEFQAVADTGLELAELRKEALEGSQLDVVQANVQKNEIDLALQQAKVYYSGAWRELVALAGVPHVAEVPLQGQLPQSADAMDWATLSETLMFSSPEYRAAQTRVRQARANLDRQCVQPIPNLNVQFAAGNDNATNHGMINLQVGAPLPLFNRNQGNIAAARAELTRACQEVERIGNAIKARIGAVSREYDASLAAVRKYTDDILPNAEQGLQLAEVAYKAGETSFVQVLVARRSYFDTNLQYIESQAQLAQARARVDGYVLTGGLNAVTDGSGDDSLRGLTFSQE